MSGDSQIVSELNQLKEIDKELKRLSGLSRELKKKKTIIEGRVLAYLQKTKRDGVKTQDIVVLAKEKISRPTKPKEIKEQDVQAVLHRAGVQNTEQAYQEILEAMKGEELKKQALVLKKK
jgi:hypothetical protein